MAKAKNNGFAITQAQRLGLSEAITNGFSQSLKLNVMEQQELYPELVDYIFDFEHKFMTVDERFVAKRIFINPDNPSEGLREVNRMRKEWGNSEIVKEMLADGFDAFKERVVNRIYANYKHELNLNLLPGMRQNCEDTAG